MEIFLGAAVEELRGVLIERASAFSIRLCAIDCAMLGVGREGLGICEHAAVCPPPAAGWPLADDRCCMKLWGSLWLWHCNWTLTAVSYLFTLGEGA